VSPSLGSCELSWLARQPIDIERAKQQHERYERCLTELGIRVISLPAEPELPDATFVEDPLVVVDEVAIVTRMGAPSRREESESLAAAIAPFRPIRNLHAPATLEGGDVLRIGRDVFVGLSNRTNEVGIAQLKEELEPLDYRVHAVEMRSCLHLKSACCAIGERRILANPSWIDPESFPGVGIIPVADGEPGAANVLQFDDVILMPMGYPLTERILRREGFTIRTIDISELIKAEAAITCSSVIFNA
jgi:dimethylargininase